nr:nucleic acid-binding, OB-fold protein [Tanacetum cinerariifolium]
MTIVCVLAYASTITDWLYLSSTSLSLIINDEKIHVLRRLKTDDSGLDLTKEVLPGDNTLPEPKTLENLLMWARNRKYDGNISHKAGKFWCDSCDSTMEYPVLRYRLELEISDDTAEEVVIMFDETATSLLKCYDSAMMNTRVCLPPWQTLSEQVRRWSSNPLHTISIRIMRASHVGELLQTMLWRGGSNSNMVAAKADSKTPELKRLNKSLLFSTPSKPIEEKKHRNSQPKGDDVGCYSDTRKKRRVVSEDSNYNSASAGYKGYSSASNNISNPQYFGGSNHANLSPLSNILHTSITIHSNTTVRRDGNIQSFCGLKLSDIRTPNTGTEVSYHSLGALSYQCSSCNATMWQYNALTVAKVATLITNDFVDGEPTRDIIVNTNDGRPKRISELHPSYMALQCPLLFPYGEDWRRLIS